MSEDLTPVQVDISLDLPEALGFLYDSPARYKAAYGGRGSAKSWSAARALIAHSLDEPQRILCARETQVSISESVHRLLCDQIHLMGAADAFEVGTTSIRGLNGSEFLFAGIRTEPRKLKSTERIRRCWVEEAEGVTDASLEILTPTIRDDGSEIWFTWNPSLPTDAVHRRFVLTRPPDSIVKKVSFRDNPWFPAVLEQERLDLLARDPQLYAHVWEGEVGILGDAFFRFDDLAPQKQNLCPPRYRGVLEQHGNQIRFLPASDGWLEVWELPTPDGRYAVGADVSSGTSYGDQHAGTVLRRGVYAEQVARLAPRLCEADYGRLLVLVASWYQDAWLGIERTGLGIAAVQAAYETGYPWVYRSRRDPTSQHLGLGKLGWETTSVSRPLMLGGLAAGLSERSLVVRSVDTYSQLASLIRTATGRPEAAPGTKDDEVFALGIALQMIGLTQPVEPRRTAEETDEEALYSQRRSGGSSWMAA